jgi:hypothetical protein
MNFKALREKEKNAKSENNSLVLVAETFWFEYKSFGIYENVF